MKPGLEAHYAGDATWEAFSRLFEAGLQKSPVREQLVAATGDGRIAAVIAGTFGPHAEAWLDQQVPALADETPRACLQHEAGRRRVKELLMRMPR